ncbi:hypothetical protein [Pararhizobium sp. IMCC21322]|nr:hypothetical protein [Pararhizobium sp. IMCC21322]
MSESGGRVCTLAADFLMALDIVISSANQLSEAEQVAIMGGTCDKFHSVI